MALPTMGWVLLYQLLESSQMYPQAKLIQAIPQIRLSLSGNPRLCQVEGQN